MSSEKNKESFLKQVEEILQGIKQDRERVSVCVCVCVCVWVCVCVCVYWGDGQLRMNRYV